MSNTVDHPGITKHYDIQAGQEVKIDIMSDRWSHSWKDAYLNVNSVSIDDQTIRQVFDLADTDLREITGM